jgi:gluconate 5-dehydrogenase
MSLNSLFALHGKTALVTGGSRGLGFAIARALGEAGARIAITARKAPELEAARAKLAADGVDAVAYQNDLAVEDEAAPLVARVMQDLGPIDVLVNNAGATWGGAASTLELRHWHKIIDVNLNGTWALTQATAVASMLPRRTGSIIMVASVGGIAAQPPDGTPTAAYHASKAAQINLARALASEWGDQGVRVNCLLPGWFETKMAAATIGLRKDALIARLPLGRFGDVATDIAGPALFLASDASRYITGHALVVDGGMTAVL